MAMMNAATAATESPAICAGDILGRSSFEAGAAIALGVVEADDVADAGSEMESTNADWLEETCVWSDVFVMDVIVARDEDVNEAMVELRTALMVLLGTTVRAVLVGKTAFFWPRQTL
jgi:hypothetical protein